MPVITIAKYVKERIKESLKLGQCSDFIQAYITVFI